MILHIGELLESSGLYKEAFTHKSFDKKVNFERLEFLGDSLVGALVTELLYTSYPKTSEGDLSRWKSTLIAQESLAELCRSLKLQEHLVCKESEEESLKSNERIQASLFEALLGAYFLEKGFEDLKVLTARLFKDKIRDAAQSFEATDYKTLFQEAAQKHLLKTPTYQTLEKTGPAHKPHFKVAVCVGDEIFAKAAGESVKQAQRAAAEKALAELSSQVSNQKQESNESTPKTGDRS